MNTVYNRYIPQSDGSYQRNRVQDQKQQIPQQKQEKPAKKPSCPLSFSPPSADSGRDNTGSANFLKQLLPKNFDTGDLLIVLLLLLMAGDCEEEKSNALLTIALYFVL